MTVTTDQIRRMRAVFVKDWVEDRLPDSSRIDEILCTQNDDGSWQSVHYLDQKRENWDAVRHFTDFLHPLTFSYASRNSPFYEDVALRESIVQGLKYWLQHDFANPNWWWSVNGLPAYFLGPVCVALNDVFPSGLRRNITEILERSGVRRSTTWRTGGNGLFDCRAALVLGLFDDDARLIERVYEPNLARCLVKGRPGVDGVQEDWSHLEHGNLVFNHGYGAALLQEGARLLWYAREAHLPTFREQLDFLESYLLDGSRWMARGDFLDYSALGRNIAVKPLGQSTGGQVQNTYLAKGARYLILAGAMRKNELRSLIDPESTESNKLSGNRLFYQADLMTHHTSSFYASVRMFSIRSLNTEQCNGVNRLGHHLGEGQLHIVTEADPFAGLFPSWDWNKIPGTTVNSESTALSGLDEIADTGWIPCLDPYSDEGYVRERLRLGRRGRSRFVGGVSDGTTGIACMDLRVRALTAKKSWFFFDDQIVCLGAGIADTDSGQVITTIDQRRLNGEVIVLDDLCQRTVLPRSSDGFLISPRLVLHDNIAYIFEPAQNVMVSNGPQTGDWNRINWNLSDEPVTCNVFALWIEHGFCPVNQSTAVRIFPGVDLETAMDLAISNGAKNFEVLRNDERVQAVANNGKLFAVFHTPDHLDGLNYEVSVNEACALIFDRGGETLVVSDPSCERGRIVIKTGDRGFEVPVSGGRSTRLDLNTAETTGYRPPLPTEQLPVPASEPLEDLTPQGTITTTSRLLFPSSSVVSGNRQQWVSIDLGSDRFIGAIELDWIAAPRSYDLSVSWDGELFTPLVRIREYGVAGSVRYPINGCAARHIRVQLNEETGQKYCLKRLTAFGR